MKSSDFVHLHCHSHYSLLDGLPKIDELVAYVKELGMDSVALTDHGVLYGAVEFYQKAKAEGIKPIIGAELYLALDRMDQRRPQIDKKSYHLLVLVKNKEGYQNLVKLITKAHLEGFYYKPRIDEDLLFKHKEGLIITTSCLQGKIPRLLLAGEEKKALETALQYKDVFGKENFYVELQHHPNIPEQAKVNQKLIKLAKDLDLKLIATNDVHYLKKEDAKIQDVLMLINTGADPNNPERLTLIQDDFSMKSPQEMAEIFKDFPEAILNTKKIAEMVEFEFELGKPKLPYFQVPEGETPESYLRKLCYQGLKERGLEKDLKAKERLEKELKVIEQTGFASYFLIVQDFVNWAKKNKIIVGPGRGSAGGSLVAYLLKITEINPLEYNLLFERFLNPERSAGLPDIDIDFTDRRRDEVLQYLREKYGENKVAQIITFGTLASRAVVRDVGRALKYPYQFCDKLAKLIPPQMSLKEALAQVQELKRIYQEDQKAKELIDVALKLEGVARHASTHACGVVISHQPLDDIVPLQHPSQSEKDIVTQYEMHSIEDLGLLKVDLLGLRNLTIIEDTLAKIKAIYGKEIKLEDISDFKDPKTFKLLQAGETTGVFQLESDGMKRYLRELKPTEFEDIVAMIALYRPGPLQFIPEYIARKHRRKPVTYLHPKLKPILDSTYGICIYQEQLMKIAQDLAGFTLREADYLRKAVGKKIKELLLEQEEKLIQGMIKQGIPEKVAKEIWNWILPFARYGFNRSHSVAYAMIAYWTAWLKAHYPVEFMASLLTAESSTVERTAKLIQECNKMGIEVLPPDINQSFRTFSVVPGEKKIRFGLTAIKNVGENVVEAIIQERKAKGPFISLEDFISRMAKYDIANRKSFEALIKAGAFDNFEERKKLLHNLDKILNLMRESKNKALTNQANLFGESTASATSKIKLEEVEPATTQEKLEWEKELLGLYISSHPLKEAKKALQGKVYPIGKIKREHIGKVAILGCILTELKKIVSRNGKPMAIAKAEDLTGSIEIVFFSDIVENKGELLEEGKVFIIEGKIDSRNSDLQIIARNIEKVIIR